MFFGPVKFNRIWQQQQAVDDLDHVHISLKTQSTFPFLLCVGGKVDQLLLQPISSQDKLDCKEDYQLHLTIIS
jgi:hypothetical protein